MVVEEEFEGGRGVVPAPADGAAAKERFGGQAEEDLPDSDLIREAGEERRSYCT
jgi:hypothetical protein